MRSPLLVRGPRCWALVAAVALSSACSIDNVSFDGDSDAAVDPLFDAGIDGNEGPRPDTTITAAPVAVDNSTSTTFEFVSDDPQATFECALDGAAFAACTTPLAVTGLDGSVHMFEVRAVNAAGLRDATPAEHTWEVDLSTPDTVIDAGPQGTVSATTAMFVFSSPNAGAGAAFECSLDAAAFAPCTSAVTLNSLPDGARTFRVRVRNAVGVFDPTPAVRTWTVDTTDPDTTITAGPTGLVPTAMVDFAFSSNETGATFECDLDGAGFVACAASYPLTNLAEGGHVLVVRAIDLVGNRDESPAQRTWTVDTQAPDTTITSAPDSPGGSAPRFDFTSSEVGATFECSLDAATYASCGSPRTYAAVGDGMHTFRVRAIDLAGIVDLTPATHTWMVDSSAPDTLIEAGPTGSVNSQSAQFRFTSAATAGATFECSLDGVAFATCVSPRSYASLTEASHQFQVRARSPAGVYDPSPASQSWTVDITAPQTTLSGGPTGSVATTSASFTLSSDEATATFQCNLDGAGFVACPATYVLASLSQGAHTLLVRAVDAATNPDGSPAQRTWTVDTSPPETTIVSAPSSPSNQTSPTFDFSSEASATFECSLDGAAFAACSDPYVLTTTHGTRTLAVRAVDAAGNRDQTPASHSWTVDTVAPNTTIATGPPANTTASVSFTFTSSEGGGFQCKLDTGSFASCGTPHAITVSTGPHTLEVRAVDLAGNPDLSAASWSWTSDSTLRMIRTSGDVQTGIVGAALAAPFVVTIYDANNAVVPGVTVSFVVTGGNGSVSPTSMATNALGQAETTLTLGSAPGANAVEARSAGVAGSPGTFTASGSPRPVTYDPKVDFASGTTTWGVSIADLNGDGRRDVVTANHGAASVSVFLNTTPVGSVVPQFAPRVDFATGGQPRMSAIADLNEDGKLDLAVPNEADGTVSVLLGTTAVGVMTPTFAPKVDFAVGGSFPQSVAIGDLNADGTLDLAVSVYFNDRVAILLGTTVEGTMLPNFATHVDFAAGTNPYSIAIGDLNADGKLDVAVTNFQSDNVSVFIGTTPTGVMTPTFAPKVDFATSTWPISIAIGDLNRDGRPDLATANFAGQNASVLLNTTAAGVATPSFAAKVDFATQGAYGVAIGDLNADAIPDLAVVSDSSNHVSVLLGTTAVGVLVPSFAPRVSFTTGVGPESVAIGDLNGDGRLDLATANSGASTISILLNR